ncbi:MAG TPA: phage Gp37/Gp68 family protein [Ignavibacteria bacterium]|nr:phage Gp37/Gp68 family protein [Ignavibacteria bacterium]
MAKSSIEWTQMTWNPTTGCSKLSAGCKNCYAEIMSKRLQLMGVEKYSAGFKKVRIHPESLNIPKSWKKPKMIFVNSMSDLFQKDVPLDFIQKVFDVMNECPQHVFQVLTKRSERLLELNKFLNWSPNIWMGVSVEDEKVEFRIDDLRKTDAKIKFLSLEPLLGPLDNLNLKKINWVIVGGESGFKARPIEEDWVTSIKQQCYLNHVPFFFKQWGGFHKKKNGRLLKGKTYNQMPIKLVA